ncbi:hypothetical protein KIW84_054638 [Lathyrus oleraceus]|uniref:Uncharacterized protein n=1 Tax=Pisum sativum TaxID=3888 RepID=A0A9D4WY65_PEA|nr:hypothetical protein KIW84_054638 [Pisum sativum]
MLLYLDKFVAVALSLSPTSLFSHAHVDAGFGVLGYVLIARPEFMLEHDIGKILEETLSSHADARLKIPALQNMFEYLLDAVAAGAGDTNICGVSTCSCCGIGGCIRHKLAGTDVFKVRLLPVCRLFEGQWLDSSMLQNRLNPLEVLLLFGSSYVCFARQRMMPLY